MPDNNYISIYDEHDVACVYADIIPRDGTDDTLKITGQSSRVVIAAENIHGGREDCLDINNRCTGVCVTASEWHSGGRYVATIKGGSHDITIGGVIVVPGSSCDIELGNWSDQSQELTTGIRLALARRDGKPVHVRLWHADAPVIIGDGPYRIQRMPRLVVRLFFRLKKWGWL